MLNLITDINSNFDISAVSSLADEILCFPFGSVAVFNGSGESDRSLLIATHTDKPHLVCTSVNGNGTAKASLIGEMDSRSCANTLVYSDTGVSAVLSVTGDDENASYELDLGAKDKEEAEKLVKTGDVFRLGTAVNRLCGDKITAPHLSVSAPVTVLVKLCELLHEAPPSCKVYVSFITEGQHALSGYAPAANALDASQAICVGAVDVTSAPDVKLSSGAVVRLSDRRFGSDKPTSDSLVDAGAVPAVLTKGTCAAANTQSVGVPSAQLDVPVKNIHTHTEIIDLNDICKAVDILHSLCK